MQLRHVLIKVDDQDKALAFYTSVMMGPVTSAFFDDTCGNFIVMAEQAA
jgi:catechol 2,3-dioxygenase-like lactoylglutathione lyase family enzyme